MVLIILTTVLILAIAFFQVVQGLFSAIIMAILSIISAAVAFNFYEPAAALIYGNQPAYAEAISLVALFVLPLLGLRILFDRFIGSNVVFGLWADRIGGGAFGIISGMILVGVLTVAIQMLPFGPTVITYKPFDDSLQRNQSLAPFYPDRFTLGMVKILSAGALSSDRQFGEVHDDLLLECFCARNTAGGDGRVGTPPDSIRVIGAYAPEERLATWLYDDLERYFSGGAKGKVVIIRVEVADSARDEDHWWRLPATHFRLVTISKEDGTTKSYYPLGYLTYHTPRTPAWDCIPVPGKGGSPQQAQLVVERPFSQDQSLTVDWAFGLPEDAQPDFLVFRRDAKAAVPKVGTSLPPTKNALGIQTKEKKKRHRRKK